MTVFGLADWWERLIARFFMRWPVHALISGAILAAVALANTVAAQIIATTDTFSSVTNTNTFTIEFVEIARSRHGRVFYGYRMGVYEISRDQIEIATALGLANVTSGPWVGDQPAGTINWHEAAAFVNWLNTNKGQQAAYNLVFSNGSWAMQLWDSTNAWTKGGTNLYRHKNAHYFLPSEDEWYKAAYYNPAGRYFLYPTGSDTAPTSVRSGTDAGTAVYGLPVGGTGTNASVPAAVTKAGGRSPYGTMGQGGNQLEWLETALDGVNSSPSEPRLLRGGAFYGGGEDALRASSTRGGLGIVYDTGTDTGFRVASIAPDYFSNTRLIIAASSAKATLAWDPTTIGPANVEHSSDLVGWTTISAATQLAPLSMLSGMRRKGSINWVERRARHQPPR